MAGHVSRLTPEAAWAAAWIEAQSLVKQLQAAIARGDVALRGRAPSAPGAYLLCHCQHEVIRLTVRPAYICCHQSPRQVPYECTQMAGSPYRHRALAVGIGQLILMPDHPRHLKQ